MWECTWYQEQWEKGERAVPSTQHSAEKSEQNSANQLMLRNSVHAARILGDFILSYGYSDPMGCVFLCISLFKVMIENRTMKRKIQWKNKKLSEAWNRDYVDDVHLSKIREWPTLPASQLLLPDLRWSHLEFDVLYKVVHFKEFNLPFRYVFLTVVLDQLPHRALSFNVSFRESKLKGSISFGKISFGRSQL